MSGIARGRLTEERKSWRKNHPHVCIITVSSPLWFCFEFVFCFRVCFDSNRFRFWVFSFCDLGFCCEAWDTAWWVCEFDDLALYYSWKNWGLLFSLIFYQFFFCWLWMDEILKFFLLYWLFVFILWNLQLITIIRISLVGCYLIRCILRYSPLQDRFCKDELYLI